MELTFSELEQKNNYWEQPTVEKPKKKKVSFDDILSNMNLVVNKNGILQSMIPTQNLFSQEEPPTTRQPQPTTRQPQPTTRQPPATRQPQPTTRQPQPTTRQPELDPSVKHSYIFNKYFKDYKDATSTLEPEVRKPKTIKEYRQMVLEERMKRIEQQKRISQIKSTKLMFTTNEGNNNNIQASKNTLKSMSFR